MKTLKNFGLLTLVWIISNLALSSSMILVGSEKVFSLEDFIGSALYMMIFCTFFSLPAFIFFSVISSLILRTNHSKIKQRLVIILINYLDIIGTFLILFLLTNTESEQIKLNNSILDSALYPLLTLFAASTLLIIIMPFQFTQQDQNKTV